MFVDFSPLSPLARYHWMTQCIIPRPIAWVLSDSGVGEGNERYNLAPYSYFNAISSDPPLVMISAGSKEPGLGKDTRVNLIERKHAVIHLPHESEVDAVTASAATLPHGESEVTQNGLDLVQEEEWPLPRLANTRVAMACELVEVKEVGPARQAVLFCQIAQLYVRDDCVVKDAKGRDNVDAVSVAPLARLGANEYASLGDVLRCERPA